MKKLLSSIVIVIIVTFVSCKNNDKPKAQAIQDSINDAEKTRDIADSIAAIKKQNHEFDSINNDSLAKVKK